MFPHYNIYKSMSGAEILDDNRRVRKNQTEGLLLISIALNILGGVTPVQAARVNKNSTELSLEKVILCRNSDLDDDSFDSDSMYESDEPSSSNSVLFDGVDGFLSNVPFNRPNRNPLNERTKELFLSNSGESSENRTVSGISKDGRLTKVRAKQVRKKGYHIEIFSHIIDLKGKYDVNYVKGLSRPEKAKYVLDPKNLPQDLVHQMQDELLKFFTDEKVIIAPGTIGPNKIEGTIFIKPLYKNGKSLVGFRNYNNSEYRTIVLMSEPQVRTLIATDFHLFPKGGN